MNGTPRSEIISPAVRRHARALTAEGQRPVVTDAMVTAAKAALGHSGSGVTTPRMRAALEAAEAAR